MSCSLRPPFRHSRGVPKQPFTALAVGTKCLLKAHKDSSSKILHFETARPREILGEVVSRLREFGARELRIESLGQSLWCRYVRRSHWFDLFIERSQEKFAGTIGQEVPTAIVEA